MVRDAVSISTLASIARAIAACLAAPKSDSISVTAARTRILSSSVAAAGMAMAESTARTQTTIVSSIAVNALRTAITPSTWMAA